MNQIETTILNCSAIEEAEKNMIFAARLTQRGHTIHNMADLLQLYNQSYQTQRSTVNISSLPPSYNPEIYCDHSSCCWGKQKISFADYQTSK